MRSISFFIVAAVLAFAPAMPAAAAGQEAQKNITFSMLGASKLTASVADIDYQARTVKLKETDGNVRTIKVSDAIGNLNQVKKGDSVTVEVQETLDVEVQRGPGEPLNIGSESQTSALPGEKPTGIRTIEGTLKTKVEAIDYEARTITCKNRKGVLMTYKIGKDAKRFDEIRRGDMLVVEYKQVTALSVK